MKITDEQIIEAGRVILQARKERGAAPAGEVPAAVTAALGRIELPNDTKAKGPSSPFTDAEVDDLVSRLNAANADATAKRGMAQSLLGLFGLG